MIRILLTAFVGAGVMVLAESLGIGFPPSVHAWKRYVISFLLMVWGWSLIDSSIQWHRSWRIKR